MASYKTPKIVTNLDDVHRIALKQFDKIQSVVKDERQQCLEDRRFYSISGAQWEGALGQQFENKPKLEFNKIHLAIIRIVNEYRNNRIGVTFTSKEGAEYDKLADTCNDLYRADEQDSNADEAKDNAFEEAVGGGYGAWRLRTYYEDDEEGEEKQRIAFEPIYDADKTVFFDLGALRQDKADAKYCFVLCPYTYEDYEAEFGESPSGFNSSISEVQYDWCTPDTVYVAEYYRIDSVKVTMRRFQDLLGEVTEYSDADFENDSELEQFLLASGSTEIENKIKKRKKVRKYLLSGNRVLSDEGYIAGQHIPIIPVYGKRWVVDGIERFMGHTRLAKDAQRVKNMQTSKLADIATLHSVEKPIFYPEQIAGHTDIWASDNIVNNPYLLINPIKDLAGNITVSGAVSYTKPPTIPPSMAALIQQTDVDIKELLGNQEQGEKIVSNISGKAVDLVQTQLGMQTYIYTSNHAKAQGRCGEVWLSMAKEVYVEPKRKLKGLTKEGEARSIEIMRPILSKEGEIEYENDISKAKFDVSVEVGASSSSKRSATVRALTGMMAITQDAETMQVLTAMAMMNMEGEGLGETRGYFRKKLLAMGAVDPTEDEIKEAQAQAQAAGQQPLDPVSTYYQASAEKALADADKAKAETLRVIADANLKEAQTQKTLAETGQPTEQPQTATQTQTANQTQQTNEVQPEQPNIKEQLELERLALDNMEKRVKIEKAIDEASKPDSSAINEANKALIAATQALEKLMEKDSNYEKEDIKDKQLATMSEAIAKVGDAINTFTNVSSQNTQNAINTLSKPKKLIREKGQISRIEID